MSETKPSESSSRPCAPEKTAKRSKRRAHPQLQQKQLAINHRDSDPTPKRIELCLGYCISKFKYLYTCTHMIKILCNISQVMYNEIKETNNSV